MRSGNGINCHRKACQHPDAMYWNKSTREWYCHACAVLINEACDQFGDDKVCSLEECVTCGDNTDQAIAKGNIHPMDDNGGVDDNGKSIHFHCCSSKCYDIHIDKKKN